MSTALDVRKSQQNTLRDLLQRAAPSLQKLVPKHLTVDRLISIALAATSRDSKLLECNPQSVLRAVIQATQLGLEPGGALGEAYLVPYGKECTFLAGYRGYIKLARQSGHVQTVEARVVHEKDRFVVRFGLLPILSHEPDMSSDPGPVVSAYAVARLVGTGDQTLVEVMTRKQLDAIKNRSRASKNGPWVTDEEEMQRKTVVRRIAKYLPLSAELAEVINHENRAEAGEAIDSGTAEMSMPALPPADDEEPAPSKDLKAHLKKDAAPAEPAACDACHKVGGHIPGCINAGAN